MKANKFHPGKYTSFSHGQFGNLGRHDAVVMPHGGYGQGHAFVENDFTFIHLSVTGRCQARCKGCINAAITSPPDGDRRETSPVSETIPERDAACILNLLGEEVTGAAAVCFYGGEPLLATDKIARVIDIIAAADTPCQVRYMLYTNGDLLGSAIDNHPRLMENMWLTSVSIDGRKDQHEENRPGTHLARIRAGLWRLKDLRRGKVLMWSTLRESQSLADCFQEFRDLHDQGLADLFFWHWVETATPYEDFAAYLAGYEKDLRQIMECYVAWIADGKVLPIIHLNELILFLLAGTGRKSSACGVELAANFDLIGGKIHACADLPLDMAIGDIAPDGRPLLNKKDLLSLVAYKDNLGCYLCGVHDYCGGRCPVQAHISGEERLLQYCQLMRLHVGVVQKYLPDIAGQMAARSLPAQALYDAAAFYAQFTDVTP